MMFFPFFIAKCFVSRLGLDNFQRAMFVFTFSVALSMKTTFPQGHSEHRSFTIMSRAKIILHHTTNCMRYIYTAQPILVQMI